MIWALSSHYFPLAYLALGPALRALDVRMEEAGLVSGGRYWQVVPKITLPLLRPAILSGLLAALHHGAVVLRGAARHRPAGAHRGFHHRDPGRRHRDAAGIRRRQRAQPFAARRLPHRRLFLSPRHAPCRGLRHHHRQGLHADPHRARPLALAGVDRDRADVCSSRSGCRCSRWRGSRSSRTCRSRSWARRPRRRWRTIAYILRYPIFLDAVRTSVVVSAMAATVVVALTW